MAHKRRLYSLFERKPGERRWKRISRVAFTLDRARVVYQTALLTASMVPEIGERRLRVTDLAEVTTNE